MQEIAEEQKMLIEDIGISLEARLGLSPLASRIYALLILSDSLGLTFEGIREAIPASKSSISVNINVLIQLKYIDYYTKPGNRRRYFKVAKYYQIQYFEQHLHQLDKDIEMIERINTFNKANFPEKYIAEKSLGSITQNHFREQQKLIKKAITDMVNFQLKDKL